MVHGVMDLDPNRQAWLQAKAAGIAPIMGMWRWRVPHFKPTFRVEWDGLQQPPLESKN